MAAMGTEERWRWGIAAVGAVLVTGGALALFRLSPPPSPVPEATKRLRSVQIAKPGPADPLLQAEAEMKDLRPLFLPTDRNATMPEPRREAGRTFLDAEIPKLTYAETDLHVTRGLPPVATINGKPVSGADAIDAFSTQMIGGNTLSFGRQQFNLVPFAPRGGFVEVVSAANGKRVLAETLALQARPAGEKAWAPMEFLAAVGAAGLTSPLVLTEGSRVEEVDVHFKNFLTDTYRLGERLEPGLYRVSVAP